MSNLAELVAQTGAALRGGLDLFGPAPQDPAWTTTGDVAGAGDAVAGAGAATAGWGGEGARNYGANNEGQQAALTGVTETDAKTGPLGTAVGQAAASGRDEMKGLIRDTQTGTAALAPATGTPAGQTALAEHLRHQLRRERAILRAHQARGAQLAAQIRQAGGGYQPGMGGGPPPGMGMGVMPSLRSGGRRHHARPVGAIGSAAKLPTASLTGMPSGRAMDGFGAGRGNPTVGPPDEFKVREWVRQHFGIPNSYHTGSWENAAHNNDGGWHPKGYAFDFHGTPTEMAQLANWVADNWSGQTLELIYQGQGFDPSRLIKDTRFGDCYGSGTLSQHTDHVHWAMSVAPYEFTTV